MLGPKSTVVILSSEVSNIFRSGARIAKAQPGLSFRTCAATEKILLTSLDKITTVLLDQASTEWIRKRKGAKITICSLSSLQHLMPLLLPDCVK